MSNNFEDGAKSATTGSHHIEETNEASDSGLPWLLTFFLLALIAAGCWYFMGTHGNGNKHEEVAATHGSDTASKEAMHSTTHAVIGTVDSSGNFIYDSGEMVL